MTLDWHELIVIEATGYSVMRFGSYDKAKRYIDLEGCQVWYLYNTETGRLVEASN